jgi:hypothetical protein
MADDPSPDDIDEPAKPKPSVPKPPRDPGVIDGEATDVSEPADPPILEPESVATPEPEFAGAATPAPDPEAAATPEPPPFMAAAASPAPRAATFAWGVSGVIVGALVAIGATWMLAPAANSTQPLAEITTRQEALEKRDSDQDAATKAIDARLAALETAQPFAKADAVTAIDKRLTKLEAAGAKPDAPAALDGRISKLESDSAAIGSIDKRLAKLEAAAAPPGAVADAAAAARAAGDAASKALALASEKAAPPPEPPAPDPRVGKLLTDEAALSDRITKLETIQAAPKAETRIPIAEPPPKDTSAAQAIAAISLEQRMRLGEPFAAEFAALSSLGADPTKLAALKPLADSGAPTASALAASFAAVSPEILAAAHPQSASDGPWDKLLDHVTGLVKVRRVSEVPGDDPDALVSRISGDLARGQIGAAATAYARLPEPCRKAAGDWGDKVQARAAADAAARDLRDGAIAKLAATKS